MANSVHDYLLDQNEVDWTKALESWSWLLPTSFTIWLVNRFGDLFVVVDDGSVSMLDLGNGTFDLCAGSRDEFCTRIDEPGMAAQWLMVPLVDKLVAAGVTLNPGQCYALRIPPVLQGKYELENCGTIDAADYVSSMGEVHRQLHDLPEGAEVRFQVRS